MAVLAAARFRRARVADLKIKHVVLEEEEPALGALYDLASPGAGAGLGSRTAEANGEHSGWAQAQAPGCAANQHANKSLYAC